MFVRQQRSDEFLVRVLNVHITMRYQLIEKNNYQVLPTCVFIFILMENLMDIFEQCMTIQLKIFSKPISL
jgi:hypothetical protein